MCKIKIIVSLSSIFLLSSCAQMMTQMAQQNCTLDAAYASGVNAAKEGNSMDRNYASICSYINLSEAEKLKLNAEYRKGYQFGLKYKAKDVNVNITNKP
ncbi:hypothetical protein [Facilibium subflavum]|uniref:hypothetical protein n=1 Tax=Facilibium subflavum TaxID=2219058 RepID=UPI000E647F7B|nr:hypothetical protein [Facilibium subflavum]